MLADDGLRTDRFGAEGTIDGLFLLVRLVGLVGFFALLVLGLLFALAAARFRRRGLVAGAGALGSGIGPGLGRAFAGILQVLANDRPPGKPPADRRLPSP